jgi:ABC-2 type transport system ATP-binding protein
MIEITDLTKRYGTTVAVDGLSFSVVPGRVTGFLGPNGAGKSTTLRVVLGLDTPTAGRATVAGRPYRELPAPLRVVGALLDATAVHGGRTAAAHLLGLARSNGLPRRRVGEVLDLVGLAAVADRRAGGFSLGMHQRLGIAAALLGDPAVLLLDEPLNGLDTEGIRWVRALLRRLAADGRAVLLSSHLMSEMELVADHVVVVGRGRLVADTSVSDLVERHATAATAATLVRAAPDAAGALRAALEAGGAQVAPDPGGGWQVHGPGAAAIGELARRHDIALHELTPRVSSLEDAYTRLTDASVEHRSGGGGPGAGSRVRSAGPERPAGPVAAPVPGAAGAAGEDRR